MIKKKKGSKQSPIEYIPVIKKQQRWITCREIAENLYHSRITDLQLIMMLEKDLPIIIEDYNNDPQ